MSGNIKKYGSLVKFSHTVFAMPFALIAFFYAYTSTGVVFEPMLLVKIVLCMVFARNAAMSFNRLVDRDIDARNPRTASREIPEGKISVRAATLFVVINAALFLLTTFFINPLAFYLSPVALIVILGYSLTKRATWLCHVVLGAALAIAPVGAFIAVTGTIAIAPLLLAGLVLTWVSAFDIIYALQDADFDNNNELHSIPQRFGIKRALVISCVLHLITLYAVVVFGLYIGANGVYWTGAAIFIAMLIYQHLIVKPSDLSRIGLAFGTTNGVASIIFGTMTILSFFF